MIFWILAAGVVVLAFVLLLRKREDPYSYSRSDKPKMYRWWWGSFFFVLLFGAMGLALYVVMAAAIISTVSPTVLEKYDVHLASIADSSQTSGHFFLGSGYLNDDRVINYVYGTDQYGYRTTYAYATQSVIYQDSSAADAHATVTQIGARNWVFLPTDIQMRADDTVKYDFHVPRGSIIENFQVDSNSNN